MVNGSSRSFWTIATRALSSSDGMIESGFQLDARLAEDTQELARWPLSRVLLMDDARYPWLILVPERDGVTELIDLEPSDQALMWAESLLLGRLMRSVFKPDKLNVAALGNVVAQLHVHHVARFRGDEAWPAPVWGAGQPRRYEARELSAIRSLLEPELEAGATQLSQSGGYS